MSAVNIKPQPAWENRWSEPQTQQLIDGLQSEHRPLIKTLMKQVSDYKHVKQSLNWFGVAWKWTIQLDVHSPDGKQLDTLCYIVPNRVAPIVCVPLLRETIDKLPMRRLTKLIRNGIRLADRAVDIYWATWPLTNSADIPPVVDLIKRKHKISLEPHLPPKASKSKKPA
ncbi:MAG: hypothetical protein CMJ20_11290 [Phycisphaeraceae bacterium]|nr:hypothetical protein [Phycisphaeraceae bacterium]